MGEVEGEDGGAEERLVLSTIEQVVFISACTLVEPSRVTECEEQYLVITPYTLTL